MQLRLKRKYLKADYTIGDLYLNDEWFCNTLEDTTRDLNKDGINEVMIFGKTSIPYGKYPIILNDSPKFRRTMPRLENVYGYSGVLIHSGNTKEDTAGCILVGENKIAGKVINSMVAFQKLFDKLSIAWANKEEITIEII